MNSIAWRMSLGIILALVLTILPLSGGFEYLNPTWVLLFLLYLQLYLPQHFHILLLIFIGLILDALLATVMGEHVFALALIAWLASTKARRFYCFTMSQQMAIIGLLTLLYQTIILAINKVLGFSTPMFILFSSSAVNVLLWPWIRLIGEEWFRVKR